MGPGRLDRHAARTRDGAAVIVVTRLNGGMFGVNPDLIQRVESAPDTILTLIDGTKLIIAESMDEVIARVNEHRARILARSRDLQSQSAEPIRGVPRRAEDDDDPEPDGHPTAASGQLRRVR
jgi:flagellar protein FlbD